MGDMVVKQACLTAQGSIDPNRVVEKLAIFNADGTPYEGLTSETQTGADILLTGLVAGTDAAVAATDSVNEAIANLQAQIDALVGRVEALETP